MGFHSCKRYWVRGLECPFKGKKDPDEDGPDHEIPVAFPGKRKKAEQKMGQITQLFTVAHQDPAFRKQLEEKMRDIAAIDSGGLSFLPDIVNNTRKSFGKRMEGALDLRNPFRSGEEYQLIVALLGGLGIAEALRRMRSQPRLSTSNVVKISEQRSASRLQKLAGFGRQPGTGLKGSGRGFVTNAAQRLRQDFGLGRKKKLVADGSGWTSTFPGGYFG